VLQAQSHHGLEDFGRRSLGLRWLLDLYHRCAWCLLILVGVIDGLIRELFKDIFHECFLVLSLGLQLFLLHDLLVTVLDEFRSKFVRSVPLRVRHLKVYKVMQLFTETEDHLPFIIYNLETLLQLK
jgi:hypothetical protein